MVRTGLFGFTGGLAEPGAGEVFVAENFESLVGGVAFFEDGAGEQHQIRTGVKDGHAAKGCLLEKSYGDFHGLLVGHRGVADVYQDVLWGFGLRQNFFDAVANTLYGLSGLAADGLDEDELAFCGNRE